MSNTTPPMEVLTALIEEAGWECQRRGDVMTVRLESDRKGTGVHAAPVPFSASISFQDGFVRCRLELADADAAPPEPHRAAVATLLSAAGARQRLLRVSDAMASDGRWSAGFEIALAPPVDAAGLGQALSALSIAARLCGPEVRALLENSVIAEEFLQRWHFDPAVPGLAVPARV